MAGKSGKANRHGELMALLRTGGVKLPADFQGRAAAAMKPICEKSLQSGMGFRSRERNCSASCEGRPRVQ